MTDDVAVVTRDRVEGLILVIRGEKVILDRDLAVLYGVETKVLVQAVKRNIERFPVDFMFQPSREECSILKSQIVTSSSWGGIRRRHYAFTELLSSVLRSTRAADPCTPLCPAPVGASRNARQPVHGSFRSRSQGVCG